MELRELRECDLLDLLDLCSRTLPLDKFSINLLKHRIFQEPEHRPEYQLSLWDGDKLVSVMLGGVRTSEEGPAPAIRLFATDPAYQRRGYATQLLKELINRIQADGMKTLRVGGSAPIYFWPGVDVRYTPAICFLIKHGFQIADVRCFNMEVDLLSRDWDTSADEDRLAREGFVFRRLSLDDREEFSKWLLDVWGSTWQCEALATYQNEPISTHIALRDGRICAFASYGGTAFENGFGPTGTEEQLRGKGIGRILFYRCMRDLRMLGHEKCEVIWVGPIPFYAKVADAKINRVFWVLGKQI
ncbi:GCN5-related N-acetyltransferase [Thermobaculum terrenum ATCC BAA-798]|uniref:GCN5-related N-acetyltransferase n=1 Tax=Thermobaculum terrenum (strain ATCC BAA-798 / CCMEE 7001 / YNP1) TaxID=525904 RepID=D1CEH1_THET1|nr:GNAT family N-acetyltransferase [Thermobaculum terrenum]ACZ41327.1 GCN5-related N-acetyltransferase [Thermobaculum terrenum ATCC BAA-798]